MASVLTRRLLLATPLTIVVLGGLGFYALLGRMQTGSYDPHAFANPLVGKAPPAFSLPGTAGQQGFSSTDLAAAGKPILVNFFASWCIPCVQEAPMLDQLSKSGLVIWGIAYQDKSDATAKFLADNGNPFQRLASDLDGRTAINWGVYGVPESFLINTKGVIIWHYAGALNDDVVTSGLLPALKHAS
ncbi:MAG: cytochrome C biogenesis protein [Rhodospirillales bacterium 20-60-12]|nr:MAG: cytochrome C biogenesis protein [Rhodospirillales bacterium 20-60-12]HQT66313.1 DsbE family thiol:disulfide interchange protein [Acetobacteraceae bacterium]